MDALERTLMSTPQGIIMANLVDFDTVYGHRNESMSGKRYIRDPTPVLVVLRTTAGDLLVQLIPTTPLPNGRFFRIRPTCISVGNTVRESIILVRIIL